MRLSNFSRHDYRMIAKGDNRTHEWMKALKNDVRPLQSTSRVIVAKSSNKCNARQVNEQTACRGGKLVEVEHSLAHKWPLAILWVVKKRKKLNNNQKRNLWNFSVHFPSTLMFRTQFSSVSSEMTFCFRPFFTNENSSTIL